MIRVAINGFGRIGKASFNLLINDPDIEVIAINDFNATYKIVYELNFDTVYGKANTFATCDNYHIYYNKKSIKVFHHTNLSDLPWKDLNIDVVVECTGKYTRRDELQNHITAGAKHVILSCPSEDEEVFTIVHGVNTMVDSNLKIVSCAGSVTNCITPILEILNRRVGIKKAIATTVHSCMPYQELSETFHNDMRKDRELSNNFIPILINSTQEITKILPELKDKISSTSIACQTQLGLLADICMLTQRDTSVEEINRILGEEAGSERYVNILGINTDSIVSSDIKGDPRASVVDLGFTQVLDGNMVKILSWHDTEMSYANQLVKELKRIARLHNRKDHYQNRDNPEVSPLTPIS